MASNDTAKEIDGTTLSWSQGHTQLLDAVDGAVIATDTAGVTRIWNEGALDLYGWTAEEAIGRSLSDLLHCERTEEQVRALAEHGIWEGEMKVNHRDGSLVPVCVRLSPIKDGSGETIGVVGVTTEATARAAAERRAQAARASLTAVAGCIDDGLLTLDAERRIIYANPVAHRLLGYDPAELSGKAFHDAVHGTRGRDRVCPAGRCELLSAVEAGRAAKMSEALFMRRDGLPLPVSFTSLPIDTSVVGDGDSADGLAIVFSDATPASGQERSLAKPRDSHWVTRIEAALEHDRFVLHAQPLVDLATGVVVQHELLIRMQNDDGSLVAPSNFLPVAERHGLMLEIDSWVVRRAAALAGAGHPVEFNVSGSSIGDELLAQVVEDELAAAGADPSLVVIEVTETALVSCNDDGVGFVDRLTALGCRLALDDFGMGYSGFNYLKQLPVHYLKIDREFVADLARDERSRYVVEAIVRLARAFGQETIAEGVEDQQTLALLDEMGVDYAQGLTIGPPQPLAHALLSGRD